MSTFQQFEQIEAWQKARELTRKLYEISRRGLFSKDFGLRDQICRSSVSTMSNIAEGSERGGTREFLQFLSTAKASAGEVRSHLYVALDQKYIPSDIFQNQTENAKEVSRMISGLMKYLQHTHFRGTKFKKTSS